MSSLPEFLRIAAAACLLTLSGCGFEPMYGENAGKSESIGPGSVLQGNLVVESAGNDRFGQIFKAALEDRFNPQGVTVPDPDYALTVTLHRLQIPAVVRSDGTILRYDLRFDSVFAVKNRRNPKEPPFTGTIRRTGSYNVVLNANFATYEAEQSLNERLLRELAEDYLLRLTGHFAGKSATAAPPAAP